MIKAVVVLVTNDFYKDQKYVMSTRQDVISFPNWEIDNYQDLENNIRRYLVDNVFIDEKMSNGYVKPKFIGINDKNISQLFEDSDSYLYFLYGCICPKLSIRDGFFWKEFDYFDTNIITELGVVNEVITKTIS